MSKEAPRKKTRRSLENRRQELKDRIQDLERAVAGAKADASALPALAAARAELTEVLEALRRLDRPGEHDPNLVEMGDTVTVREERSSETERYTIVDPVEASVGETWISAESPLGSALLGRRAADTVIVEAPGGTVRYTVISIDRS
ncbi:MAG: GreA/GreB family elongation factor [Actinomycetota bacterium]